MLFAQTLIERERVKFACELFDIVQFYPLFQFRTNLALAVSQEMQNTLLINGTPTGMKKA